MIIFRVDLFSPYFAYLHFFRHVSPTRRLSDVSTIGLEDKPVFRPIKNGKPPKPKSVESNSSLHQIESAYESRQNSKKSVKSQLQVLNKKRISPPHSNTAKVKKIF